LSHGSEIHDSRNIVAENFRRGATVRENALVAQNRRVLLKRQPRQFRAAGGARWRAAAFPELGFVG
jgi:hypothetical protein